MNKLQTAGSRYRGNDISGKRELQNSSQSSTPEIWPSTCAYATISTTLCKNLRNRNCHGHKADLENWRAQQIER